MNPFERFLTALFGSNLPSPTQYPQYATQPEITKEDVSLATWNKRFKSPLADSLKSLGTKYQPDPIAENYGPASEMGYVDWFGSIPKNVGFNTNPLAYGQIKFKDPEKEKIFRQYLQAPASITTPRSVMIHEYGHLANEGELGNYGVFNVKPEEPKLAKTLFGSEAIKNESSPAFKAAASIDPYYRTNPSEAFAQAFVNAWEFLQETKKNPKMDYRKFVGDLEANTPGMGLIIRDLLKEKTFENHPLRGKIFTTGENANAAKPRKNP